ncbi:hypothetical protein ACJJTC_013568 [Scirpophaga incertulas]
MSQVKTRQTTSCPVFGLPEKLPVSQLPTYSEVMKYYIFIKYQLKTDKTTKEPTVHDISEILAEEILTIWQKASLPTVSPKKKRLSLLSLALACDRTGVSDRAAAMIASSVLKDVGIVSSNDTGSVIDRSKLRRERTKVRTALQNEDCDKIICGIYFDGRKDKTLVSIQQEGKFYRKRVTEDHYVILSEPGSEYFGHVTCDSGTAKGIESTILTYLKSKSVELGEISVVGCDGTVVNTGSKGGVIRLMEEELKKTITVVYLSITFK